MPDCQPRRAQTSKQAKAAFKARGGGTFVSPAEKKRLERWQELERRAERARERETKRREIVRKRVDEEIREKRQVALLGSQKKLDKYGIASSQFHLGKFFAKPTTKDLVVPVVDTASRRTAEDDTVVCDDVPPTSPVDVADFLMSDDQAIQDITYSTEDRGGKAVQPHYIDHSRSPGNRAHDTLTHSAARAPASERISAQAFPSFSSDDGLFDESTVLHLDRVVEDELVRRRSQSPTKESGTVFAISALSPRAADLSDKMKMPPPCLLSARKRPSVLQALPEPVRNSKISVPPIVRRSTAEVLRPSTRPSLESRSTAVELSRAGVSKYDLESLVDQEIILTQVVR